MQETTPSGPDRVTIEIHLKEIDQLFDTLDHSPFHEKDLDRDAEEYIVDAFNELPDRGACAVVIHVDSIPDLTREQRVVEEAVRVHFARRARFTRLRLKRLLRVGWTSLIIGLTVLVTFFLLGQSVMRLMGDTQAAWLIRESLLIGGWVAMWRPIEILLYDWWPLVSDVKLHDRLSRLSVRLAPGKSTHE